MKPRTEAEIADYIRRSLEPLAGKVVEQKDLAKHLTKVLGEIRDLRRPKFEVEVTDVASDGTVSLTLSLPVPEAEMLAELLGKPCRWCSGYGQTMTRECEPEPCDVCKGRGRVPF